MKRSMVPRIVVVAALACLLFAGACSDSDPVKPDTEVKYKALTDKENLIYNLVQSYKDCNIDEYAKLLYIGGTLTAFPEDYVWYNQAEDVMNGKPEFYSRETDIEKTGNMFLAKLGLHPDPNRKLTRLNLAIVSPGSWQQVTELAGEPCEDCWETTRNYHLELYWPAQDITTLSNDLVTFYAIGIQANERTEYRILRADDISEP